MHARIEVEDRQEAQLLRRGLEDKEVRAFVKVCGAMSRLPSRRSQERVFRFVFDRISEEMSNGQR